VAIKINLRIPVRHRGELLTWGDDERQRIAQAALDILDEVGIKIHGEDNLRMIQQAGGLANGNLFSPEQAVLDIWPMSCVYGLLIQSMTEALTKP